MSSGDAKNFIEMQLSENKIVVFSKSTCPYAKKAKQVFKDLIKSGFISYEDLQIIELNERSDGDIIQTYLGELTGARTVPRVFVYGKCIGGGDETSMMNKNGSLKKLIENGKC